MDLSLLIMNINPLDLNGFTFIDKVYKPIGFKPIDTGYESIGSEFRSIDNELNPWIYIY